MSLVGYNHILEGDNKTYCNNSLNDLRTRKGLLKIFYEKGLVCYESKNFLITLKSAPYSDKDGFIVYSGENTNVSSLTDLTNYEFEEFIELLSNIEHNINKDFKYDLQNGNNDFIIGLNTSVIPGLGMVQSVFRPHFHFTLLNTIESTSNNIKTQVLDIVDICEEKRKIFCIRDENIQHMTNILNILDDIKIIKNGKLIVEISYILKGDHIDFLLPESYLFHKNNIEYIKSIYSIFDSYLKNHFYLVLNGDISNFGFSIGFKKIDGKNIFRLKFFVKKPQDNGGSMEMFYHSITRNRVENPNLPDMTDWQEKIKSYF